MLSKLAIMGGGLPASYSDDVFATAVYRGSGAVQTIVNGLNFTASGGLLWTKALQTCLSNSHLLFDTNRGGGNAIYTDRTGAALSDYGQSFTSSGFAYDRFSGDVAQNQSMYTFVSWSFLNAARFFYTTTVTKLSSNVTVNLSSLGTVGMVAVKRTDDVGSWYVWHRSCTSGKLLYLEQTAAEATLGHITVSGTTLTLVDGVIANGTYVIYAWAHDAGADGIIQCGTYTTDGTGKATVTLGWEPQFTLEKQSASVNNWEIAYSESLASSHTISPNLSAAETSSSQPLNYKLDGFDITIAGRPASTKYIYMAIRRPNKLPTLGTKVYNGITRTATGAADYVTGVGFSPDVIIPKQRNGTGGRFFDRRRGLVYGLSTTYANPESSIPASITRYYSDGITLGDDYAGYGVNQSGGGSMIFHFFKRATGVLEPLLYTGTGANKTEAHGLGVAPELWFVKSRNSSTGWRVGCTALANTEYLVLESTAAKATDATVWNSTFPTSSVVSLGTQTGVNESAKTYAAYLFASVAGVSKVFSYTGNGSSQTINCAFTTGARFVLIKRTDAAGDWFVWDTARGIIAGNDPHLSINTNVTEVTTNDSIDPDTSGFIVNQVAATNINVTSATYIGLAFA